MLGESEGTTGHATVEEVGRRRSYLRTATLALVLLIVQQPMTAAVRDLSGTAASCAVPGRLSLLVDWIFIIVYAVAAFRCQRYVRCLRLPRWQRLAATGARLVYAAAVLDVIEGVLLWRDLGTGPCTDLSTGWLTWLMRLLWLAGVGLVVVSAIGARRGRPAGVPAEPGPPVTPAVSDEGRLVICCSGGGIRSASFCLGALHLLSERGLYQRATSVIGVSGGGYMAAAFHISRRTFEMRGNQSPYAPGSPELARLRRQTRYLLQGSRAKFRAALSLLYGVSVNLLLIGITLRAVAWVLGWFLADQGVLGRDGDKWRVTWFPDGSWFFVGLATALIAFGVLMFVLEKIVDRLAKLPDQLRLALAGLSGYALLAGLPVAVLLLGVPAGLKLLNTLSGSSGSEPPGAPDTETEVQPQPVLELVPRILLDLVDPGPESFASFGLLAGVLVALGRSVWKGLSVESKDPAERSKRSRLMAFVRSKVAPWVGTAVILVAMAVVLLRWTGGYATDSSYRSDWSVALVLAAIAVGIKLFTDANRTSLHPYYRERLSTAFLGRWSDQRTAIGLRYSDPLKYSDYAKPYDDGPQLVVGAVANVSDVDFVPSERDCVPFVFDPSYIGVGSDSDRDGLPPGGIRRTEDYELDADYLCREVTVPAAMAISGAAFSPLTGRANSRTRPVRLLLALVNARLGVWLPNPYWSRPLPPPVGRWQRIQRYVVSLADKPGAYRLLREAVGSPSLYERRLYITDGGHYDNFGLVEALRRRPAQVIVIDATSDPEDRFSTLGQAIATARMDHGIAIEIDPSRMKRGAKDRADRAWAFGIARHPDGSTTEIFLLKALLAGTPSWDVEQYAAEHPDFPRRSTGDQFYGEWDFEAYRALGYELAVSMLDHHRIADRLAPPEESGDHGT